MVTDYKVVKDKRVSELESRVLNFIVDGWEPIGGITSAIDGDGEGYLLQVIVKS